MKRLWHTWWMLLVWDIFHASMNVEGGQLTWCCTTREHGRKSQSALYFGNLSFEAMLKRFILWSFDSGDFSIEVFKICNEDLFIGDFSYEDLFIGDFSLKNWDFFFWKSYLEDLSFKHLNFFLKDLFMEIFPWRFIQDIFPLQFWKTLMKICP